MSSSLLPEQPIVISPTLAATIGLEQAVLLQKLAELISHRGQARGNSDLQWLEIGSAELAQQLPFWNPSDISRLQDSLRSLGMLRIESASGDQQFLAIEQGDGKPAATKPAATRTATTSPRPSVVAAERANPQGAANQMPPDWRPDENWVRLCKQHAIPDAFIQSLIPEFVTYWRDRGQARFSWGNAFYKHVLKEWRHEQTRKGAFELASTMSASWQPSQDAIEILVNAGISHDFIEDAIAEFVLYWRERGVVHAAWNTKFIEHIRRQWAKFSASFGRDDTPRPIASDWQPSADCFEILQLAEIDEDYARSRIAEFVLYWTDSQQAKASWNTVFLQFIKQDWARRLKQLDSDPSSYAENQSLSGTSQQRIKERFQRIADRSWAD